MSGRGLCGPFAATQPLGTNAPFTHQATTGGNAQPPVDDSYRVYLTMCLSELDFASTLVSVHPRLALSRCRVSRMSGGLWGSAIYKRRISAAGIATAPVPVAASRATWPNSLRRRDTMLSRMPSSRATRRPLTPFCSHKCIT